MRSLIAHSSRRTVAFQPLATRSASSTPSPSCLSVSSVAGASSSAKIRSRYVPIGASARGACSHSAPTSPCAACASSSFCCVGHARAPNATAPSGGSTPAPTIVSRSASVHSLQSTQCHHRRGSASSGGAEPDSAVRTCAVHSSTAFSSASISKLACRAGSTAVASVAPNAAHTSGAQRRFASGISSTTTRSRSATSSARHAAGRHRRICTAHSAANAPAAASSSSLQPPTRSSESPPPSLPAPPPTKARTSDAGGAG